MWLVEVAGPMHDIDDGNALSQQVRRVPCPRDRPICGSRDASRTREAPLGGSHRESMTSAVEHRVDNGIMGNHALAHEPGDERVRVLVRGILPRRTGQPERSRGGAGQRDITPIAKRSRKTRRPEGSQLEPDRHPVAFGGTIGGRRPSLRPADGEKSPVATSGDHHLPMTGHKRQKLASAFAPRRPDALDESRLRRPILKRQEHGWHRGRALILGSARHGSPAPFHPRAHSLGRARMPAKQRWPPAGASDTPQRPTNAVRTPGSWPPGVRRASDP